MQASSGITEAESSQNLNYWMWPHNICKRQHASASAAGLAKEVASICIQSERRVGGLGAGLGGAGSEKAKNQIAVFQNLGRTTSVISDH